jgi:hypothetical protein
MLFADLTRFSDFFRSLFSRAANAAKINAGFSPGGMFFGDSAGKQVIPAVCLPLRECILNDLHSLGG